MITAYARHCVEWWTDGVVRKVLGILLLSPVLIILTWTYANLLFGLCVLVGIPDKGAIAVSVMMTFLTVAGAVGVVIDAATSE